MQQAKNFERFGIYRVLRLLYDRYVRNHLPRKIGVYNGVPVRDRALFDVTDERPEYEAALVAAIRQQVTTANCVVIIGGGRGVSTVSAAVATGPTGEVISFEGGTEQYQRLVETVQLNQVSSWVNTRHAIVGSDIDVYGDASKATTIAPAELPSCNVLVLDCEGAEIEILRNLDQRPKYIIVETHGFLDSPESKVREILDDLGYEVVDRGIEYESEGVFILSCQYQGNDIKCCSNQQ